MRNLLAVVFSVAAIVFSAAPCGAADPTNPGAVVRWDVYPIQLWDADVGKANVAASWTFTYDNSGIITDADGWYVYSNTVVLTVSGTNGGTYTTFADSFYDYGDGTGYATFMTGGKYPPGTQVSLDLGVQFVNGANSAVKTAWSGIETITIAAP